MAVNVDFGFRTLFKPIFLLVGLAVAYLVLWSFGLVTAAVLFGASLLVVFFAAQLSPEAVRAHWWLWMLPFVFGSVGYVGEHFPQYLDFSIPRMAAGEPYGVASVSVPVWLLLVASVFAVSVVAAVLVTRKRKRRRR